MQRYLQLSLYALLALCICSPLQGQNNTEAALEAYKRGEVAMLNKDYRQASKHFERATKLQTDFLLARHALGNAYELLGNYAKAAESFAHLVRSDSLFSRVAYYKAGHNFYRSEQADSALNFYDGFRHMQKRPLGDFGIPAQKELAQEPKILDNLTASIRAVQVALDSVKFINLTEVINLGKGINGPVDDYFPFLTNDREWLYYTRQAHMEGDEDLFVSRRRQQRWGEAEKVKGFNTAQPEGMTSLVRDGRRMFFTACRRDSTREDCDIWLALADGNRVENAEALGAPLNSPYWESQTAISCDGRTIVFASNRPGGRGGSDLYQSERLPDGRWGEPRNLGPLINTDQDEEAPFLSNDGQSLFFSSDGHPGLGEQDIFMCWWDASRKVWSQPINLGPPVNGPHRELGLHLTSDGRTGYFASDRPGGEGGMDIYEFELSEHLFGEAISYVQGFVMDSILRSGVPAQIDINGRPIFETYPDGRFFLCVGADEVLDTRITVDPFKPYHNQFVIPAWDNRVHYDIEILLQPTHSFLGLSLDETFSDSLLNKPKRPTKLIRHTIYFGFDDNKLNVASMNDLADFAKRTSKMEIKRITIAGFADRTGTDVYNLRLSEERAKNVAIFLVQHGLTVDQIHIEGMGVSQDDKEKGVKARRVEVRLEVY